MAPIDRREHRQQRVRGAGTTAVQGTFGFSIASLGARPSKQNSLPPPRPSRQTPNRSTPRAANGSVQRHRSASLQRSGSTKPKSASKDKFSAVTPQLGKRKRGSSQVLPPAQDEEDELSPDREELVHSIEKSRRVVGTVSPIHEEVDNAPDELSVLDHVVSTTKKRIEGGSVTNGTPISVLARKRMSTGSARLDTPTAISISGMTATSRRSLSRRSESTELGPSTPSLLPNRRSRLSSASRVGLATETPRAAQFDDGSEDELSPPQTNGATPRIIASLPPTVDQTSLDNDLGQDELSSPAHPGINGKVIIPNSIAEPISNIIQPEEEESTAPRTAKRGRPRRVVEDDEEEEHVPAASAKSAKRGRPPKTATVTSTEQARVTATPIGPKTTKDRSAKVSEQELDEEDIDELSPNNERTLLSVQKPARREDIIISDGEGSDAYEEQEPDEEQLPTPRPPAPRLSPKKSQQVQPSSDKPPRKRQKFLGPKHSISVLRIKGSSVRGITVADTTRTILEETIEHRLSRMAEKLQACQDSSRRKELRTELNLSFSFRESLNEKLLDLQDANDVLSSNLKKLKLFKRDNADLRKSILSLQNTRQELALEHDDVQMVYEADKAEKDARNQLNEDLFEIEAAVQEGRARARDQGREDEGPDVPLPMLLDTVGTDVGSSGRGLLSKVKVFNSALERAAGWLEGRG